MVVVGGVGSVVRDVVGGALVVLVVVGVPWSPSSSLKLEKETLCESMGQSPQQPVIPSSQPMSIPPPPQREPDQTIPP